MEAISENTIGSDDLDGTITLDYNIDNVWRLTDAGHYDSSGGFHCDLKTFPIPDVDTTGMSFIPDLFWPFVNPTINPLSWDMYARTFVDVGEDDKSLNLATLLPWNWHIFERLYFETYYKHMGDGGMCFGMSLEALYARRHRSVFVEPIYSSPFNTYSSGNITNSLRPGDEEARDQLGVKHGYQQGLDYIEWYLGKRTAGAWHDPVRAFRESRDAFARSDWPMFVVDNNDGKAHAVIPYSWDPPTEDAINSQPISGQKWKIDIADPNWPGQARTITIDPFAETFDFPFTDGEHWTGEHHGGGQLLTVPFNEVSCRPLLVGDFIGALIRGGVVVLIAGAAGAAQLSDQNERTYYRYGDIAGTLGSASARLPYRHENLDPRTQLPNTVLMRNYATGPVAGDDSLRALEGYYLKRSRSWFTWPKSSNNEAEVGSLRTTPLQILHPHAPEEVILCEVVHTNDGSYSWHCASPCHSVQIGSPATTDCTDWISIHQPCAGSQTVLFRGDHTIASRSVQFVVAGWMGDQDKVVRRFVLDNCEIRAGQVLLLSLSNGGRELWVRSIGHDLKFDLEISRGVDVSPAARSNLQLASNVQCRIRPTSWEPSDLPNSPLRMAFFDTTGVIVTEVTV